MKLISAPCYQPHFMPQVYKTQTLPKFTQKATHLNLGCLPISVHTVKCEDLVMLV